MSKTKRYLYWVVYILLLLAGMGISYFDILPIVTTSIFLLGLFWIWTGISLIMQMNPHYAQQYCRREQFIFSATSIGLGVSWTIISCTEYSNQVLPMIIVSLPFLLPDLIMFIKRKRIER